MVYRGPFGFNLKEEIGSGVLDVGSRQCLLTTLLPEMGVAMCSASACGLITDLPSQVGRDLLFHLRILK